jgi:hypothetical protein
MDNYHIHLLNYRKEFITKANFKNLDTYLNENGLSRLTQVLFLHILKHYENVSSINNSQSSLTTNKQPISSYTLNNKQFLQYFPLKTSSDGKIIKPKISNEDFEKLKVEHKEKESERLREVERLKAQKLKLKETYQKQLEKEEEAELAQRNKEAKEKLLREEKEAQIREGIQKRLAERKEAEEKRLREEKEAQEKRLREEKEAEEKRLREEKEAEEKRLREEAEEKKLREEKEKQFREGLEKRFRLEQEKRLKEEEAKRNKEELDKRLKEMEIIRLREEHEKKQKEEAEAKRLKHEELKRFNRLHQAEKARKEAEKLIQDARILHQNESSISYQYSLSNNSKNVSTKYQNEKAPANIKVEKCIYNNNVNEWNYVGNNNNNNSSSNF